MGQPFISLFTSSILLAFEAQQVMVLRWMRLAGGGAVAHREMTRMVTEKALAASQVAFVAASGVARGDSPEAIAGRVVRSYRGRVRKNRRRLS